MKARSQLIYIAEKAKENASIGLIEKTLILRKHMPSACPQETGERSRRSYLNILNILSRNGMHLTGGVDNEEISPRK